MSRLFIVLIALWKMSTVPASGLNVPYFIAEKTDSGCWHTRAISCWSTARAAPLRLWILR